MKIIITGATGFIGKEVVYQSIAVPKITSIVILSRRALDDDEGQKISSHPKVKVILHRDFEEYPLDLLREQLHGASACLWCIGGKVEDFPSLEVARTVGVDFTLAAAMAFAEHLVFPAQASLPDLPPQGEGGYGGGKKQKFTFVYCSGNGAEWDQDRRLWVFSDTRKLKGAAEKGLFDITAAHPETFAAIVLRPDGVLPSETGRAVQSIASVFAPVVAVDCLARAMVRVALGSSSSSSLLPAGNRIEAQTDTEPKDGGEEVKTFRILENADILRVGAS